jgi:hypothetical protein
MDRGPGTDWVWARTQPNYDYLVPQRLWSTAAVTDRTIRSLVAELTTVAAS